MLSLKCSGTLAGLKYLMVLPVCLAMLFITSPADAQMQKTSLIYDPPEAPVYAAPSFFNNRDYDFTPLGQVVEPRGDFANMQKYFKKAVKYNRAARQYCITGNIIALFSISDSHQLGDITILKSLGFGCDGDVIKALKDYDISSIKPGSYKLGVTYYLKGFAPPKTLSADSSIIKDPSFIGEVLVSAYVPY